MWVTSIGLWVELAPPPFWLESTAVVDIMAGWCSWSSGISPKVGCSDPSTMVNRIWVVGGPLLESRRRFGVDLHLVGGVGSVVLVA
jgi:hypothetical protein